MVLYLGSTDCHVQFCTDVHTEDLEEKGKRGGGGGKGGGGGRRKRRKERGTCMCDMWRWLGVMEGPCVDVPHETKGGGVCGSQSLTSLSCPYKV